MNTPNFEEFRYKGSDDWAAINRLVRDRKSLFAPTGDSSDICDQKVSTFLTSPSQFRSDSTVVRLTEFSDDNRRASGAVFDALIAESTGCNVIAANLPGVDFYSKQSDQGSQELTRSQIEDLRKGSFLKVGAAVMNAVYYASSEFGVKSNYILLGSSMGASLIAGAANTIVSRGGSITGLTMAEPLNVVDRSVPKLARQFVIQPTVAGYSAMNPQILHDVSGSFQQDVVRTLSDFKANSEYAGAIGRNALLTDLEQIDYLEDVPVYLTRGGASALCPEDGFNAIINKFKQVANVEVKTFGDEKLNPHDHPYCLTVQSFIDAVDNVLSRS